MSRSVTRLTMVALATALAAGCGARAAEPREPGIEQLRQRAHANPKDAAVQRQLAFAEMLAVDGDPDRAREQLERALQLAPNDERLRLLAGLERYVHGQPGRWLEQLLQTLRTARDSPRASAPAVAEAAAGALGELMGAVPRYPERVREPVHALLSSPGTIGPAARYTLGNVLIELAYRRGDLESVEQTASELGCLAQWRVAGPFGPRALLSFDREHAAAGSGPLKDEYDLGAGRGTGSTREIKGRGCTVHLGGASGSEGGTHYAETFVEVPQDRSYVLRLETPNAVELRVDGERVVRLDARREPTPHVSFHTLDLTAGRHEITAKITSRHPNPVLAASLTTPRGHAAADARATENDGAPRLQPPAADSVWRTYLRAAVQVYRGDPVGARETLRGTIEDEKGSTAMLQLRAGVALSDPLRTNEDQHNEARRLLQVVARHDDDAWYPHFQLARIDAAGGHLLRAIERLRKAERHWPQVPMLPLHRARLLRRQGWEAQAQQAVRRAEELVPDACDPIRIRLGLARQRSRVAEIKKQTRRLVDCDARSSARLTELLRQRRWDAALKEVERLARLEPKQDTAQTLSRKLRVARGRGDAQSIDRLLDAWEAHHPGSKTLTLRRADRLLARGQRSEAQQALRRAIEHEPSRARLRWIRSAIGGDHPLDPWRIDGLDAIERFERADHDYGAPQVLVLDYTVERVFENGASLQLTHQIYKLQSDEAVNRQGEFTPPQDGRVLQLRTIKADGHRPVEPDRIQGKKSISLPDLEPGDYIEYEQVRMRDPPRGFPGGAVGDRFFFQSFETPFDRSELVLVAPQDMEVVVDARGDAPETRRSRHKELQVLRWKATDTTPLTKEPMSVSPRQWVPSVNWGINATWNEFVRGVRDMLADRNIRDPAAERLVQRIVGGGPKADDPRVRARRLYYWVLEHIERSDEAFGSAPAMLAERRGHRARILAYLLRLADVPARLVLSRDAGGDQTRSPLPNDKTFKHLIVEVQGETDREPVFLSTAQRGAPFGYLPPRLRNQQGLALTPDAPRVKLPPTRKGQDRRDIEVDVKLAADGSADVAVQERFHGVGAVSWRNNLEGVPSAVLKQRFGQRYLTNLVSGARLTELQIDGRDSPEQPLVLRYRFEVASLGHTEGTQRVISELYPAQLAASYARTAQRSTTQLVTPPQDIRVTVKLQAPQQAKLPEPLDPVKLEGPHGARFSMTTRRGDGALAIERRVRVPIMRVQPSEYDRFARFCRRVDSAETRPIRITMP